MPTERRITLYTVGHSSRSLEELIAILKAYCIERVIDVRQSPFSKRFPHFCLKPLKEALEGAGVEYNHNERLGGKGRAVVYDNDWNGTATREGIREVHRLMKILQDGKTTVLLCSEGDWRQCHREILADIMVHSGSGIEIKHISARGDKAFQHPVKEDLSHIDNPVDAPIGVQSYRGMPRSKKFDKK